MLNWKKIVIICISSIILYVALISPKVLPDVTIEIKDAIIIVLFVIGTMMILRTLSTIEAKALEKKISTKHYQMKAIINNSPLIMYLKDTEGRILMTNQAHANFLGYKKSELIGKTAYDLYENYEEINKEDMEMIKNKQVIKLERDAFPIDGKRVWCRVLKAPVLDDKNNVIGIVVIFQNVEEEKELEERKQTFVATLTHDLKTPTISQIKALDILLKQSLGPLNNVQQELLGQIEKSCKYMYDLIYTILDTYVYDSGNTKIDYEEFNIDKLINDSIAEVSNLLKEKNQNIVIDSNLTSSIVSADKFQLKRVIINILSNATNYGYSNTDIILSIKDSEDWLSLDVTNKGKYIPEEKLIDIFEKYKNSANAKFRKTGTGLGLYLSKQIIDAHNGEMHARSCEDETSTFGFSIPKQPVNNNAKVVV